MNRLVFALGLIIVLVSCKKTEAPITPPPVVIQEESIKFTTNLDTGIYNVIDTLPLVITVSSKIPSAGVLYSIAAIWSDSSKQIFKLDTSLNTSNLSLYISGLKKAGNYALSISVTSKSTTTNSLNKSIVVVNNPLGRFTGYRVDQVALALSKQKDFGTSYWQNNAVMLDEMVIAFQSPIGGGQYGSFLNQLSSGDFNNDGYIDVFNAGASYNGVQSNLSFLIWNTTLKKFEDKNLFNDKTIKTLGGNQIKVVPIYLNSDAYIDMVVYVGPDEGILTDPPHFIKLVMSDGKGGYDLQEPITESPLFYHEGGGLGDLNGDKVPDLAICYGGMMKILWGSNTAPYFNQNNAATFAFPIVNMRGGVQLFYKSDNGFGEVCSKCIENSIYDLTIEDVNKDGLNDLILNQSEDNNSPTGYNNILINKGQGRFNETSVVRLPKFDPITTIVNGNVDYIIDDINNDGLNDIIALNQSVYKSWNIYAYFQQKDGSYTIDKSIIQYTINSTRKGNWKSKLIYFDYNGDGKKDIGYIDDAANGEIKYKSVFIRSGNNFIEQDYFQYDPYAKSILTLIK